jgi:uncharacterized protein YggE
MAITLSTRTAVVGATGIVVLALAGAYKAGDASATPSRAITAAPAASQDGSAQPGITVVGLGRVTGTPDVLRLRMAVDVRRGDVDAALNAANADLARVRDALRKNGVAARDLQTSGLSIQPTYTSKGAINGYEVTESLTANLRDVSHAGRAIGAAATAGGNAVRVDDISFDLEGDAALLESARSSAFANAKAKAQQYADAAGRDLGALTSVNESVAVPSNPYAEKYDFARSAGSAASSVPISAGTQEVTVTVTAVWALK